MEERTFANQDLANASFNGQDLAEVDFSNADLRGSSFKSSLLSNTNFNGADLRGCDFTDANLTGASFKDAKVGINDERVADILLKAVGTAFLLGIPALLQAPETVSSEDLTNPSSAVGISLLAALFSLIGVGLFSLATYQSWLSTAESHYLAKIIAAAICLAMFALTLRDVIIRTRQAASTSFKNSTLSGVRFDTPLGNSVNFSGAIHDVE
jgi:uncharacterized protein YjbI with pentapeptide repeats